jgi:hypothetical protein
MSPLQQKILNYHQANIKTIQKEKNANNLFHGIEP